jgi:hypothetical protein
MIAESIPGDHPVALGADKASHTKDFVKVIRQMNVTPHVAQNNKGRRSAIDERTTRHDGYAVSQQKRKRVEEIFGWMKTSRRNAKPRHRGWQFRLDVPVCCCGLQSGAHPQPVLYSRVM